MPAGRPRTISLPPDQMIALGEEMIKWVIENDPIHLSEFYCIHKGFTDAEWDTMHIKDEFFPYYEKALKLVGLKYLKKDSEIEPSLKQRWQRVYFRDVRKQEDLDLKYKIDKEIEAKKLLAEHEHKIKSEKGITIAPEEIAKFEALMEKFSSRQFSCNMDKTSINADNKS